MAPRADFRYYRKTLGAFAPLIDRGGIFHQDAKCLHLNFFGKAFLKPDKADS